MTVFAVVIPYEGVSALFAQREAAEAFIAGGDKEWGFYIEEMEVK